MRKGCGRTTRGCYLHFGLRETRGGVVGVGEAERMDDFGALMRVRC